MAAPAIAKQNLRIKVRDTKESTRRIPDPNKPDSVHGKFWFTIDVSALEKDVYVPVSVASGKKPAGFLYQIEGTVPGAIKTTDLSCKGAGITQITHGTIVYARIPAGLTASFALRIEMRGALNKSYRIHLYQLNYKLAPTDARYQKLPLEIRSKMEKFK